MRKLIVVLATLISIFMGSTVLAESTPEWEKSLSKGSVGRFQAIQVERGSALIIDTKEGYLWVWGIHPTGFALTYQGQVFPGKDMGEVIERWQPKKSE